MPRKLTDADLRERFRKAGVRTTRQRLALGRLLFGAGHRHVTADSLRREATAAGTPVAVGTVYNTLHRLAQAGLLQEMTVDSGAIWFDTNTAPHHHFLHPGTGKLKDIAMDGVSVQGLPEPPAGTQIASVHVLVRLQERPSAW